MIPPHVLQELARIVGPANLVTQREIVAEYASDGTKMAFPPVGPMVIQPWDTDFEMPEANLPKDPGDLQVLPVGAAFSRLWNDDGTWRPVA